MLLDLIRYSEKYGIPYSSLRKSCINGDIPCVKIGKKFWIDHEAIMEDAERKRIKRAEQFEERQVVDANKKEMVKAAKEHKPVSKKNTNKKASAFLKKLEAVKEKILNESLKVLPVQQAP